MTSIYEKYKPISKKIHVNVKEDCITTLSSKKIKIPKEISISKNFYQKNIDDINRKYLQVGPMLDDNFYKTYTRCANHTNRDRIDKIKSCTKCKKLRRTMNCKICDVVAGFGVNDDGRLTWICRGDCGVMRSVTLKEFDYMYEEDIVEIKNLCDIDHYYSFLFEEDFDLRYMFK